MVQVSDQDMNTHLAEISRVSTKLETTFKCTVPDKSKAAGLFVLVICTICPILYQSSGVLSTFPPKVLAFLIVWFSG